MLIEGGAAISAGGSGAASIDSRPTEHLLRNTFLHLPNTFRICRARGARTVWSCRERGTSATPCSGLFLPRCDPRQTASPMTKRKNRSDESQCGAESEPILILDTTESDAGPAKRARLTAPDINSAKVDDKNDIVRQGKGDQLAQSMPLPQLTRSASEASARESDPGTGILGTAAAVTISGIGIYVAAKFLDWLTGSSDEQNNKPSAKGKQPPVAKPNMTATPPQKGAPSANGKQPPAAKPNTTTEPPRKNESSATHNQPAPGKSNTTAAPPPKGKSSAEVKQPAATTPNMTTDIPVSGPVPAENQSSKSRAEAPVVVSEAPQQASPRSTNGLGLSSKLLISESDVQIDESRKIGGGGFGEVYMGTLRNATRVAVKKVRGTLDTSAVQGFIREAQVWEGLGQRNGIQRRRVFLC